MKLVNCEPQYWEFVRNLRNDERNQYGFFSFSNITQEEQITFMTKNSKNYKICLLDDNTPVGYVGIILENEITYCVHPDHKNKGIGTFMVNTFSDEFKSIFATVKVDNISSQKVFEKLNWEKKILYFKKGKEE